ncbi:hypothetical protein V5O48_002544 [Marasmius crinis-equi]|uniref:Arrestin C-terminal-like domain-containing protein n=1 Tax=Marasmius crinis-equi TaxID=585013 RepID=A0ABR3FVU0_9AGAR
MYESSEVLGKSTLARHGTLLSAGASPARNAAELKVALGNVNSRLKPGASILSTKSGRDSPTENISLEQAKSRARVEIDLVLERYTCVQGGYLNGVVKVRVRGRSKGEGRVLVAGGKLRVIGVESIQNENHRHPFYLQSAALLDVAPLSMDLFDSKPDAEGFCDAKEGVHAFPFSMMLPVDGEGGTSKGAASLSCGASVRYLVLVSLKVKERETNRRSIAHFYRDCEIWPRHNPSCVLSPANEPNQETITKTLFMGGSGKVTLIAATHRLFWIAGQQCPVKIKVINHSKKTIKNVALTLVRSTVIFKPAGASPESDSQPPRDREMTAVEKEVAESALEMAQRVARGHASAKGWWTGVHPDETLEFSHSILIPPDALSIAKSRLLEVTYSIRVSINAGALTSDLHVLLPIRVINFLSVDPPPTFPVLDKNFLNLEDDHEYSGLLYAPPIAQVEALRRIVEGRSSGGASDPPESSAQSDPDDGSQEDYSMDSISPQEDNEEFVQRAISSMIADAKYGEQGARFADLYYESIQEDLADIGAQESESFDDAESQSSIHESLSTSYPRRSSRPESDTRSRMSTFPQRVQQKMEDYKNQQVEVEVVDVSAQKRPVLVTRQDSATSSRLTISSSRSAYELGPSLSRARSSTIGSYFRPRDEIPDEIEQIAERDDYDEYDARFLAYTTRRADLSPNPELASQRSVSSRVLPLLPDATRTPGVSDGRVPPETDLAVAQFHRVVQSSGTSSGSSTLTTPNARTGIGPRPRAQTLPGTDPRAVFSGIRANSDRLPSAVAVGAGGSVKDRIRALEEKARAERESMEASGPL